MTAISSDRTDVFINDSQKDTQQWTDCVLELGMIMI